MFPVASPAKSALFVSHQGQRCGVYQLGIRVFNALRLGGEIRWQYLECSSADELAAALDSAQPDILVLNYHPGTMPWAASRNWRAPGRTVFSIFHEVHQNAADKAEATVFDYLLCPDPTLVPRNPVIVPVPRVTIEYTAPACPPPSGDIFTVGSFGFATHGKGFDQLCALVNAEFETARIRLNIPPHDNEAMVAPDHLEAVIAACHRAITKPGIDLVITHAFMDDDALMAFLASNTINAFLYDDKDGRGITSCADYAIACGRPLAVNDSSMFRHLHQINPSICVGDCPLAAIASRGGTELAAIREAYRPENAGKAWETAILAAVEHRALCHAVPDGRGFNKLLDDRSRHAYADALECLRVHAPELIARKIERANIQQAFALDTVLRLLPQSQPARILAIGSYEDTSVAVLRALGYRIDDIDPNVNGLDLAAFYRSAATFQGSYDIVLCVSVLEHVDDDATFMRMTADLLAPDGVAIFTVDFAENYTCGAPKPLANERFYTTDNIHDHLMALLPDCALLDTPTWSNGAEDFEYKGCHYGFAGWVFRKLGSQHLRQCQREALGQAAWKRLLTGETAGLAAAPVPPASAPPTDAGTPHSAPPAVFSGQIVDTPSHRLVYDLRFDGGSRELQLGLKMARLLRKISWKINPKRRRKHIEKKTASVAAQHMTAITAEHLAPEAGIQLQTSAAAITPELADRIDAALITLALDRRRNRESPPPAARSG